MCEASLNGEICRLDGNHRFHCGGYGGSFVEWDNLDFIPPAKKVNTHKLHEIATVLGKDPKPFNGIPPFVAGSRTSEEAALLQEGSAQTKREAIFELLQSSECGLTDLELEGMTGWQGSTVRPRRRELQLEGRVRDSGVTRLTDHNRRAVVWIIG